MKKLSILLLTLISPTTVLAACTPGSDGVELCTLGSGEGANDVAIIINNIIGWVLAFGGAVAVLFIVYGGFQYLTAAGNEKQATTAKQTLTWAIVGLVVILLAQLIVTLVATSTVEVLNK